MNQAFTLAFLGSIVKIDHPSTIHVSATGIEILPLEARLLSHAMNPLSEEESSEIETIAADLEGDLAPVKLGRKVNPNSIRQRMFKLIQDLLADKKKLHYHQVKFAVQQEFPTISDANMYGYMNECPNVVRKDEYWSLKVSNELEEEANLVLTQKPELKNERSPRLGIRPKAHAAIKHLLQSKGEASTQEVFDFLCKTFPDNSPDTLRVYSYQCRGIDKMDGIWSLAPIG